MSRRPGEARRVVDSAGLRTERCRSLASEAHVWLARPDVAGDAGIAARCRALLDEDELRRLERLRRDSHRRLFLVAHALVRTALSRYADVPPAGWSFARGARGRPEIAGPVAVPLRFNLSHTDGLAVCLVTDVRDCGVDVECIDRRGDPLRVARRVATDAELASLAALPEDRRRERFLVHWTLKEAYVKARGVGLELPLRHYGFHVDGPRIRIEIEAEHDGGDATSWQFEISRPTPRHVLAVAIRRGELPDRSIVVTEVD